MAQLRPDDASAAFTAFFDDVLFDDDGGESFVFFFDAGDAGDFAIAFGPFDGAVGVEGTTFPSLSVSSSSSAISAIRFSITAITAK